jgi:mRNA interferase MazF
MQKEIWMADLNPVVGSEQSGIRPVIIISGASMNEHYSVVIMCPLTSKVKPLKGCPVISPNELNHLKTVSQAIPFQVRTISKSRLTKKIGSITNDELEGIQKGLEMFLKY